MGGAAAAGAAALDGVAGRSAPNWGEHLGLTADTDSGSARCEVSSHPVQSRPRLDHAGTLNYYNAYNMLDYQAVLEDLSLETAWNTAKAYGTTDGNGL